MELIVQGNLQADSRFMNTDEYHCDNNNILGCADRFRTLKDESARDISYASGLMKLGRALHIVQDFYSHSNWVENYPGTEILAPLEHPWLFVAFPKIQTGYYNLLPVLEHTDEAGKCFTESKGSEDEHFAFATHACLNKDSGDSFRGLKLLAFTNTYHDLAAKVAREHTVKVLIDQYKSKNPHLLSCLVPATVAFNCGVSIYDFVRPD